MLKSQRWVKLLTRYLKLRMPRKFQKYQYHISTTPRVGDMMLQSQIIKIAKFSAKIPRFSVIMTLSSVFEILSLKIFVFQKVKMFTNPL